MNGWCRYFYKDLEPNVPVSRNICDKLSQFLMKVLGVVRSDRRTQLYPPPPIFSGNIKMKLIHVCSFMYSSVCIYIYSALCRSFIYLFKFDFGKLYTKYMSNIYTCMSDCMYTIFRIR